MRSVKQSPHMRSAAKAPPRIRRRKLTPAEQRLADELLRGDLVIEVELEEPRTTKH